MVNVYVGADWAGTLFHGEREPEKYLFGYTAACPSHAAVSLSMPVVQEQYPSAYAALHPVFDMNLPEGALAERLRKEFGKVVPNFDALAMLQIVGQSQIGRLRFAADGQKVSEIPAENLQTILAHDGAQGLFESLLSRYAVHSGISGAMPKVMIRAAADGVVPSRLTHRGATHIVKAWTDEYPRLAENEYFCMRAALHAGLEVPHFELSQNGKFLVLERFDLDGDQYLGFEDFCVLNGVGAIRKYDSSYERIAKRIHDFVSPEHVRAALDSFFKALALSCAVKNGDAHLKNFGVLYANTEAPVRLAPIYDVVTTTAYMPLDSLALTLAGSKSWPNRKKLIAFARTACAMSDARAKDLLEEVGQGVLRALDEMKMYMASHADFSEMGAAMLAQWQSGLQLSVATQ